MESSNPMYITPRLGVIETAFTFHSKDWCHPGVSFTCAGMDLPMTSILFGAAVSVYLPPNLRPGRSYITLCFNQSPVFNFPYDIYEKMYMQAKRPWFDGVLLLQKKNEPLTYRFDGNCSTVQILEVSTDRPASYQLYSMAHQSAFSYVPQNQPYLHQSRNDPQGISPLPSASQNGSLLPTPPSLGKDGVEKR